MSRPIKYEDEALLESLRATFLELGPGATSVELARRAGVSEGTLFKRFGTKRRLFELAMRLPPIEDQLWFRDLLQLAGQGSLRANLTALAHSMMTYLGEVMPLIETLMSSGFKPRDLPGLLDDDEAPPHVLQTQVTKYLEREMKLGRMRQLDGRTLADLLLGACFKHVHEQAHFAGLFGSETTDEVAARIASLIVELTGPVALPGSRRRSTAPARKSR
jgi:AcrR family transcriptional regulator